MLKRTVKILVALVFVIITFFLLYILAVYTFPYYTVNHPTTHGEIKIIVISNGVHTDIAVPAKNYLKDWSKIFPKDSFQVKNDEFNYIAFGWGDKGFYLNTLTWNDLTFSTAFKACFGLSESAMHVRYLKERKKETETCVILMIDSLQYKELTSYIENSFELKNKTPEKIDHPGYGDYDLFYEAKGRYSLFKTCNIWTNAGLKTAGVKVAFWSPFAAPLLESLKP